MGECKQRTESVTPQSDGSDLSNAAETSKNHWFFDKRQEYLNANPRSAPGSDSESVYVDYGDPNNPYKYLEVKKKQGIWERAKGPMAEVYNDFKDFISTHEFSDAWGDPTKSESYLAKYSDVDPEVSQVVLSYAAHLYMLHQTHPATEAVELAEKSLDMQDSPVEPRDENDPAESLEETRMVSKDEIQAELEAHGFDMESLLNEIDDSFSKEGKLSSDLDHRISNLSMSPGEKTQITYYIDSKYQLYRNPNQGRYKSKDLN